MSIITGIVGSVQGGGVSINPIQASYGAWPGEQSPQPNIGGTYGTYGSPYNPGDANHFTSGLVTGHLVRRYYSGYWVNNGSSSNDHPEIFDGSPNETINDPYISFGSTSRGDGYCLEWKGYWIAPSTGNWNFATYADDVCWLWLGDAAASPTDSNALCKSNVGSAPFNSVYVNAGAWYKIRIRYQEWGGGETLGVFAGPSGTVPEALYKYPERLCYNGLSDGY